MKNIFLLLATISIILASCTKNSQVKVSYETTGAISEYYLYYLVDGTMQEIMVQPQSAQDKWNVNFTGDEGDIVYASGKYNDPNSALKILIKVDGKIYKQASNQSDTLRYLTVSGVVPYK